MKIIKFQQHILPLDKPLQKNKWLLLVIESHLLLKALNWINGFLENSFNENIYHDFTSNVLKTN
jgi:hypothetical protein